MKSLLGACLALVAAVAVPVHADDIKVGIIGCGGIANNKHLPALKANSSKNEIIAFCDIIPERAEKAAKEFGAESAKV